MIFLECNFAPFGKGFLRESYIRLYITKALKILQEHFRDSFKMFLQDSAQGMILRDMLLEFSANIIYQKNLKDS